MRIYLKGGNGFLGKEIYSKLNKIHEVIIIDRKNYKKYFNKKCDIFINCSTNSKKYLSNIENDFDSKNTVFNILHSINNYKFKKYLLISTCEVYNDISNIKNNHENAEINFTKLTSYGLHKYIGELILKNCKKDWLILRCNGLIGKNMKKGPLYDLINNKKIWINKNSRLQLVSINHVANIIDLLIKYKIKNEIFNISANKNISMINLKKIVGSKSKLNRNYDTVKYNINIKKISKFYKLPNTIDMIRQLLHRV